MIELLLFVIFGRLLLSDLGVDDNNDPIESNNIVIKKLDKGGGDDDIVVIIPDDIVVDKETMELYRPGKMVESEAEFNAVQGEWKSYNKRMNQENEVME